MELLANRPTNVMVAAGNAVTRENAKRPDFLTPYLEAALATRLATRCTAVTQLDDEVTLKRSRLK